MPESGLFLTGWGHTRFGRLPEETLESLVVAAGTEALASAGVEPGEVDAILLGNFNAGIQPLAFSAPLALGISDDLRGVPVTRVENACSSGSAAIQQGFAQILSGQAQTVLVIGAEKMTDAPPTQVGRALLGADYEMAGHDSQVGFAGRFAEVAQHYEDAYGPVSDTLAVIAAKSHDNALRNPLAHLRKALSVDFCATESAANPMVAPPLRRTDCSPVSDGAAAVVLSGRPRPGHVAVEVAGFGTASDFHPAARRNPLELWGTRAAWAKATESAGVGLADLDFVEVHDCFTIAELLLYEVLGITAPGRGAEALREGTVFRDGALPVNPSGGLKSKGHPVGATGVSQHVLAAMQLTGTAGDMQLDRTPRRAAVHNMGGLAITNYVSVLTAVD